MTTVVLYHANCYDGFGAAWVANEAMAAEAAVVGEEIEFIPAKYEEEPGQITRPIDKLYMLDFTYKREQTLALAEEVEELIIIDHHASAEEELEGIVEESGDGEIHNSNIYVTFDMEHSGAILTWNHFFGHEDPPELLKYIEDRDLWNKNLPGTDEVNSALRMYSMDFDTWDQLMDENGVGKLRGEGELILEFTNRQVSNICDGAYEHTLGEWGEIPVVNTSVAWSEVGHELLRRFPAAPFVGSYTILNEGQRKWSLRSEDGRESVKDVAIQLGERLGSGPGGGHRNAAGFVELIAINPGERA